MKMWWLYLILLHLSSSNGDMNCYFSVFYSNGSRSSCLDEECSNHLDLISLKAHQCQTNYLSLKFSSYSKYSNYFLSNSTEIHLSSYFPMGRPNLERLLQIEFLSPVDNDQPFQLDQWKFLTNTISNIDTYELIFPGNLVKEGLTLFLDQEMFLSNEQVFIDTLRLVFNCIDSQRVEWELIKSIPSLPQSPCPQQIDFLKKHSPNNEKNCLNINHLISVIVFLSVVLLLIIALFLWNYHSDYRLKEESRSMSGRELISMIEKF